jgi:hypothetical protein
MKIEIDAIDKQLVAAAEVLKRIGWSDIRKLSATDEEAYDAQYTLEAIRRELAEQGYNPR